MADSPHTMLGIAAEQADAITGLVVRLVERQPGAGLRLLARASRAECEELRSLLLVQQPTLETCEAATLHLLRLELMLRLTVDTSAQTCHAIADRLALREEFGVKETGGGGTSARRE